jgi:hypothetical protein
VSTGALRDNTGAITGESFGKFLHANRNAIADTQSPGAVMRLQSIASALKVPQGELADALRSEVLPTAAGVAMGCAEGGIIGGMLRHATHAAFGGLDAKRQAAFSAAIEKAVLDPEYAAKLTAEFTKRSRYLPPARALVQAVAATIPAGMQCPKRASRLYMQNCERSRRMIRERRKVRRVTTSQALHLSDHLPRAVRLPTSPAASGFGASLHPYFLGVSRTAAATILIIVTDLDIAVRFAAGAAPIIPGVRTTRFEAAILGVDRVAAVFTAHILSNTGTDDAAKDRAHRRSGAALRSPRYRLA